MSSKINRILFFIISVLSITPTAWAQCYFAQTDKLSNVWVIAGPELICFDKNLKRVGSYTNLMLGNPSTIDVSDPFKVAIFYPQAKSLVLLNNKLAIIGSPISLSDEGIGDAILACRSGKRGFWVFDRSKGEIIHFDSSIEQSGEKVVLDVSYSNFVPLYMQESNGVLFVAFKGKGIGRFDSFGATLAEIPVDIDSPFIINNKEVIYQSKGKAFIYNIDNYQNTALDLDSKCLPIVINDKFYRFDTSKKAVDKL